ncbi:hypothetical protein FKW77_004550 [Venturia effusa]|uniref:Uncharacterized protein n=1 Tax=Venturia effusa TaxID=50376 RepID=A0A517LH26_9PEZI|nr:hypothetical protein FKW77_004550 [Venturia effusa]
MAHNPPTRASMTPHEDWLSDQQSRATTLATEARTLSEENAMLRQNIRKAEEIATADDQEKTALREEVKELCGRVERLEKELDDSKTFIEQSFGSFAMAAGIGGGVKADSEISPMSSYPVDEAVVDEFEEQPGEATVDIEAEVWPPVNQDNLSILEGLPVNREGMITDADGITVGALVEGTASKIFKSKSACNNQGEFWYKSKLLGRARLV